MNKSIGTALTSSACKVLFCGAGELGKEVIIAMQRFGVEVSPRPSNAPACRCTPSHYQYVDGKELRRIVSWRNLTISCEWSDSTSTLVERNKKDTG